MFFNNRRNHKKWTNMLINICLLVILEKIYIIEANKRNAEAPAYQVCYAPACIQLSNFFQESMDVSVDPCHDFYDYVCGGWVQKRPLQNDLVFYDRFTEQRHVVRRKLIDILKAPDEATDSQSMKNAKKIYKTCIGQLDAIGEESLKEFINYLGGWPILIYPTDTWDMNETKRWQNISMHIDNYHLNGPLYRIETRDHLDYRKRVIGVRAPMPPYPDYAQIDYLAEYDRNLSRNVVYSLIGENMTPEMQNTIETDIDDMIYFSKRITEIARVEEASKILTIDNFQGVYNQYNEHFTNLNTEINWLGIIQNIHKSIDGINENGYIYLENEQYFQALSRALSEVSLRVIVNYMIWSVIRQLLLSTSENMRFIGSFPVLGEQRDLQCLYETNLKHAIQYEYIKKYVPPEAKVTIIRHIQSVKGHFLQEITNAYWIDRYTKNMIRDKISHLRIQVAGPDWYSDEAIDNYYKNVEITDNYFKNVLNIRQFDGESATKLLLVPFNITAKENYEWNIAEVTDANAVFNYATNTLCITAGALDGFLYDKDRPLSTIYGMLGSVAGHEMYHAIDPIGRQYDKDGYSGRCWSINVTEMYNSRLECFKKQYNYYVPEIGRNNNGEETILENIADVGLLTAYEAYKDSSDRNLETRLPGMETVTATQLFFIGFASTLCESVSPNYVEGVSNKHSRGRARVRGVLSNMPEFAAAFNCQADTQMNPRDKCVLWE